MYFLQLTFLYWMMNFVPGDRALEASSVTKTLKSIVTYPATKNDVAPEEPRTVLQSKDNGKTWQDISKVSLENDEESKAFLKEEANMVESKGVIISTGQHGIKRSTDNGETWEWVINEGGVGIAVERIDGGFAAITYNTKMKSRRLRISLDDGKTWNAIDEELKPSLSLSSVKQIGAYLVCGHPDGIFRSSDMGKTWDMVHSGVANAFTTSGKTWDIVPSRDNAKVFKIYLSGDVLYAVLMESGC